MRRSIVSSIAVAALIAGATHANAATKPIKVGDYYYVRAGRAPTVTVKRNDLVVWNFVGRRAHTVHSTHKDLRFQSPPRTSGRYPKRVTRTGTFTIFCDIHGSRRMRMTLKVQP
jgi:plastocyanin